MAKIKIITDSASDLPKKQRDESNIGIVSLSVRFSNWEIKNTVDLDLDSFWVACKEEIPETAAPSPGDFKAAFLDAKSQNYSGVVCITLSSLLSGTYNAAVVAAQEVSDETFRATVIDSKLVTIAQGLVVLKAAKLAETEENLEALCNQVMQIIDKTKIYGMVDSLEFLRKGGRIGGAQAFLGTLLSYKPIIEIRNGKVEAESRQRTTKRAIGYLVDKVKNESSLELPTVVHARSPFASELVDRIKEVLPEKELLVAEIGPIIGAHVGPGTLGVAYITD